MGGENQQTLMNEFGHRLIGVYFSACQVNASCLLKCSRLVELEIGGECSLDSFEAVPETFLPILKKIQSDICLREMSASFLNKSTLTEIRLECFNLVTEADDWSSIKKLWPQLESFSIAKCKGLGCRSVERIFSSFRQLKTLALPKSILEAEQDLRFGSSLAGEFKTRNVDLTFKEGPCTLRRGCCRRKFDGDDESYDEDGNDYDGDDYIDYQDSGDQDSDAYYPSYMDDDEFDYYDDAENARVDAFLDSANFCPPWCPPW